MTPVILSALVLLVALLVYRRWLEHERARVDEIKRRERLRMLLRPRK